MTARMFRISQNILTAAVVAAVCSICLGAETVIDPATATPPELSARAGVLIDDQSGLVLWDRRADERIYPASVTKMMTGLLTVEHGDLDDVVEVSPKAAAVGEASLNLAPHEKLTLRQLLKGLLIKSANDAAVAIAEHISGDLESFIALMNLRARELGLEDTHFENPHGLHSENHYSTAGDLSKLARAVMAQPELAKIVGTEEDIIPWPGKPWERKLENRNLLLGDWDACDGIKTGWTTEAGRCLAASATIDGWRLIAVVLNCDDSWGDAETLLKWGFERYQRVTVITEGPTGLMATISRGQQQRVETVATEAVVLPVPRVGKAPKPDAELPAVEAPVERGQVLGSLWLSYRGHEFRVPLVARETVQKSFWARAMDSYIPQGLLVLVLALSVGVLTHGAATKIALARRRRISSRRRGPDRGRASESERADRDRTRDEGRSGDRYYRR